MLHLIVGLPTRKKKLETLKPIHKITNLVNDFGISKSNMVFKNFILKILNIYFHKIIL